MKRERDDVIEGTGVCEQEFKGGFYRVRLSPPLAGEVLCKLSGRMAKNRVRVLPGDAVSVEVSAYDTSRGRITFRGTKTRQAG